MADERKRFLVFWGMQDFRSDSRLLTEAEAEALFELDPLILTMGYDLEDDPYFVMFRERGEAIEAALHVAESAKQLLRCARAYGYTIDDRSRKVTPPSRAMEEAAIAARLAVDSPS